MSKVRKPKMSKLPKKPKQTASVANWENWHKRAESVQKANDEKITAYYNAIKKVEKDKAKKKNLIEKAKNVKPTKKAKK